MKVHQAYRFALDPTPAQEQRLRSHAGAARYAWNWGLDQCRKRYEAERKWYSGIDLHRLWNEEKRRNPRLAWGGRTPSAQEAFRNLERALRDFVAAKNGNRKGRRLGFPRRKQRGWCRDSFRFSTGVMRCSGTTVTLPRLGAPSAPTNPPRRWLARWRRGRPGSSPPPCPALLSAGSCRSAWKSSARFRSAIGGRGRRSASTWGSPT